MTAQPATIKGRPFGWDGSDGKSYTGYRRLACAMLLAGYLSAGAGDSHDALWVKSPAAASLADLVGLPRWPPQGDYLSMEQLIARAETLTGSRASLRGSPAKPYVSDWERQKQYLKQQRDRRARVRAEQTALFADAARVTSTSAVQAVVSLWSSVGVTVTVGR